jgi:hypothetical protein
MAKMRAKLKINSIETFEKAERLKFSAVSASSYTSDGFDENNSFAAFTPQADLSMLITNKELLGTFAPGEEFYLDFTPVNPA